MSPSPYPSPQAPGDDPLVTLASSTTPSAADEQLARAWARAGELAQALRETNESLALERQRNRALEAELLQLRETAGGGS